MSRLHDASPAYRQKLCGEQAPSQWVQLRKALPWCPVPSGEYRAPRSASQRCPWLAIQDAGHWPWKTNLCGWCTASPLHQCVVRWVRSEWGEHFEIRCFSQSVVQKGAIHFNRLSAKPTFGGFVFVFYIISLLVFKGDQNQRSNGTINRNGIKIFLRTTVFFTPFLILLLKIGSWKSQKPWVLLC